MTPYAEAMPGIVAAWEACEEANPPPKGPCATALEAALAIAVFYRNLLDQAMRDGDIEG